MTQTYPHSLHQHNILPYRKFNQAFILCASHGGRFLDEYVTFVLERFMNMLVVKWVGGRDINDVEISPFEHLLPRME